MKKMVVLVLITLSVMIAKLVVSGAYYDYFLQKTAFAEAQLQLIDDNKRRIATIEHYKSPNFLFKLKDDLAMSEITPEQTIILNLEEIPLYSSNQRGTE